MRRRWPLLVVLLVAVGVAAWWRLRSSDNAERSPRSEAETANAPSPRDPADLAGMLAGGRRAEAAQPSARTPPTAAPKDDDPSKGPMRRVALVGRVVDGRRLPVANADVRLVSPRLAAPDQRTDAGGRFRLQAAGRTDWRWLREMLHLRSGTSLGVVHAISAEMRESEDIDLGTIELRPALPVTAHVVAKGKPVAGARVEWWASGEERATPVRLGEIVTSESGDARWDAMPVGWMNVVVRAPDGWLGVASAEVDADLPPSPIEVRLEAPRVLDVRVETTDDPSAPIAGAAVRATVQLKTGSTFVQNVDFALATAPARTDADGHTRIEGLPAAPKLGVVAEIGGRSDDADVGAFAQHVQVRLAMGEPAGIVYGVVAGERPVPAEGTKLRVLSEVTHPDDERDARIEGGKLVVPGVRYIRHGLAIAPDGSVAPLIGERSGDDEKQTTFAAPRALTVRIRSADGHPVRGVEAVPRRESVSSWSPPRRTDADGRVVFERLPPWSFDVFGFITALDDWGLEIGKADLSAGDASVEIVVGEERTVVVQVTVGGKPALPSGLLVGLGDGVVLAEEEDGAAGVLRLRARPLSASSSKDRVRVRGRGLHPAAAEFDWPAAGGTATVSVALGAMPEVTAVVRANPGAPLYAGLERWDDEKWKELQGEERFSGPGTRRFAIAMPGRYRLRDLATGVVTEPRDVLDGGAPIEMTLDLTSLVAVRGRIETPEGAKRDSGFPEPVFIVVEGPGIDMGTGYGPGRKTERDGRFEVRVPAGRRVTLRPWHETLQPARGEAGSIVVDGARDGIVLRLVEGPKARFRVAGFDPAKAEANAEEFGVATLWARALDDKAARWLHRDVEIAADGSMTAAGVPTGETEIWIDVPPWAPLRLDRRALAEGVNDLGEVRLERGTALRLRFRGASEKPPPGFDGYADRVGEPSMGRAAIATPGGPAPAAIHGLLAGKWKVSLSWTTTNDDTREFEREIDVDGAADLTLDVE